MKFGELKVGQIVRAPSGPYFKVSRRTNDSIILSRLEGDHHGTTWSYHPDMKCEFTEIWEPVDKTRPVDVEPEEIMKEEHLGIERMIRKGALDAISEVLMDLIAPILKAAKYHEAMNIEARTAALNELGFANALERIVYAIEEAK